MDMAANKSYLLDCEQWARATLLEARRVRETWSTMHAGDVADLELLVRFRLETMLDADVHFLIIAANQLVTAQRQKNSAALPSLSKPIRDAVEHLRNMKEHPANRSGFTYSGRTTPRGARFLEVVPQGNPWMMSGNLRGGSPWSIQIANCLQISELESEVSAILIEVVGRLRSIGFYTDEFAAGLQAIAVDRGEL
jgi:hypothetical protein